MPWGVSNFPSPTNLVNLTIETCHLKLALLVFSSNISSLNLDHHFWLIYKKSQCICYFSSSFSGGCMLFLVFSMTYAGRSQNKLWIDISRYMDKFLPSVHYCQKSDDFLRHVHCYELFLHVCTPRRYGRSWEVYGAWCNKVETWWLMYKSHQSFSYK